MLNRVFNMTLIFTACVITACMAKESADAGLCEEQTVSTESLIERSPAIVIATAKGDQKGGDKVDLKSIQMEATKDAAQTQPGDQITAGRLPVQLFSAVDYLKGEGPQQFSVFVAIADEDTPLNTSSHDDEFFWSNTRAGRTLLTDDCGVQTRFTPGETYLIFTGPPHVKAYEEISADDDDWLSYVRRRLDEQAPAKP